LTGSRSFLGGSVMINRLKNACLVGMVGALALAAAVRSETFLPVCERTNAVKLFLEEATRKSCDAITEQDLQPILRVAVPDKRITVFKDGDFSGLPNLEILNIKGNPFQHLQPGLLAGLPKLKTLVIFRTGLTELPEDFLESNPEIAFLHMFGNPFTTLPESVRERFASYQHWEGLDFDQKVDDASGGGLSALFPPERGVTLIFH